GWGPNTSNGSREEPAPASDGGWGPNPSKGSREESTPADDGGWGPNPSNGSREAPAPADNSGWGPNTSNGSRDDQAPTPAPAPAPAARAAPQIHPDRLRMMGISAPAPARPSIAAQRSPESSPGDFGSQHSRQTEYERRKQVLVEAAPPQTAPFQVEVSATENADEEDTGGW
ncbi:MAG: hypothetical protein TREMPRED_005692, partial [Tremellales sp. Tagirdzhanova-0007]